MLPTNGEWLEIGLLLFGPVHALVCLVLAVVMGLAGRGWNVGLKVVVLAGNLLLAAGPIVEGVSVAGVNRDFRAIGLGIAALEVFALLALGAASLLRAPRRA